MLAENVKDYFVMLYEIPEVLDTFSGIQRYIVLITMTNSVGLEIFSSRVSSWLDRNEDISLANMCPNMVVFIFISEKISVNGEVYIFLCLAKLFPASIKRSCRNKTNLH